MSKGAVENARVKKEITESLFVLLLEKKFSEITITDIIKEAKVARVSYYRNYKSKEAIIEDYIKHLQKQVIGDTYFETEKEVYKEQNVFQGFEKALKNCLANKSYLLRLYDNGFSSMIQELLNCFIEDFAGFMPRNSIDIYKLYFISGAVFNVLIQWLKRGAKESPRDIAGICVDYLKGEIIIPS